MVCPLNGTAVLTVLKGLTHFLVDCCGGVPPKYEHGVFDIYSRRALHGSGRFGNLTDWVRPRRFQTLTGWVGSSLPDSTRPDPTPTRTRPDPRGLIRPVNSRPGKIALDGPETWICSCKQIINLPVVSSVVVSPPRFVLGCMPCFADATVLPCDTYDEITHRRMTRVMR